jgi:small ligand-binding sensory domain FIST
LVRSIIGADPNSGAVAISAEARIGQTVQYQLRDPVVAGTELHRLINQTAKQGKEPYAGILCTCLGRGRNLFREPNHDVSIIQKSFPNMPITGVFTSSEICPVGPLTFTHGYTASMALISPA